MESGEVYQWLKELALEEYWPIFRKTGFDSLRSLRLISSRSQLETDLHISKPAHQNTLWEAITQLKASPYQSSSSAPSLITGRDLLTILDSQINDLSAKIMKESNQKPKVPPRNYVFKTCFGSEGEKKGKFQSPCGLAMTKNSRLIVCDSDNYRVQVIDVNDQFSVVNAFGTDGDEEGEFDGPTGVCCGEHGEIIVSDRDNHRIQIFDESGNFIRQFGTKGSAAGKFQYPAGVALSLSATGNIVVCDSGDSIWGGNDRIQIFSMEGKFIQAFGSKGDSPGQFNFPKSIWIGSGKMIIGDDSHIQIFDESSFSFERQVNKSPLPPHSLNSINGICVDDDNQIIVSDGKNDRVIVFSLVDGSYLSSFGSHGSKNAAFDGPYGVVCGPHGSLFISDYDNHRIHFWNKQ